MRYQTKLLITAGLLLAMSLSAAALAYWGVAQSHMYLTRSRLSHEELERQLQLSRHSQQLFKSWTDTLLTGMTDKPLGAAYLHKVIQSDLATLHDLTVKELAIVGPDELKAESAELDRLEQIKKEFQHTLDQLAEVEQLRSRGRPDIAWQNLITLLKGGIDQKLNELIEVAVADETAEVIRIDADAAPAVEPARADQPDPRSTRHPHDAGARDPPVAGLARAARPASTRHGQTRRG